MPTDDTTRRVVRVVIASSELINMFRTGWSPRHPTRCVKGIPPSARCIATVFDNSTMTCALWFEDDSFQPVPLGQIPPILMPVFEVFTGHEEALTTIRDTESVEDATARWMQQWAAWALEPDAHTKPPLTQP